MKNNYVAVILISSILINTSCHKDDVKQDETPPILSCTPVALSTVSSFIAFGADLSATQKNPAFEYLVNSDSVHVRISSSGKVERIFLNDNFADYEIWIMPFSNSVYRIIYDHVTGVSVKEGVILNAGEIIGTVGIGNRTELQINKVINKSELAYCPFNFGTKEFIEAHKLISTSWCLQDTVVP
ncbi:MAG TPA: hypothetical protein PLC44_03520 [Saprospiraceae bacterium]|nr:hypothetical protein [Saprospiraceae bacterium]